MRHKAARGRRAPANKIVLVGIDTGGTFTDIVASVGGELRVHKALSTPDDPARAVVEGIRAMLDGVSSAQVTYSTTVATNVLLEKKGGPVAIFTNAGFEDLIEIGRQNRSDLYALAPDRPEPLVAHHLRFGVRERTLFDGAIETPLSSAELARAVRRAKQSGARSIAICLLHCYANPKSEAALARALAPLSLALSVSHRILPEYREYERLSTTVVNAYVAPAMVTHLESLERQFKPARLRVMQSNGVATGVEQTRLEPVRTLLSGPAAGVIGAAALVRSIGINRFITFDMGGTSTDVSLFDRRAHIRTLSYPAGYAVRTPVIDIHTVGAGGGSIASLDAGGSLRAGPESAGANPGPACYGRGNLPTVTDANLIAGRLVAENFLGGHMELFPRRAAQVMGKLGKAMGVDPLHAARGVIRVVNANMERAVRLITIERGFDPREFALMAFGGAGPMHACELALDLGIKRIVMPRNPGLLCAWGALGAPLGREYSITIRDRAPSYDQIVKRARPLIERSRRELIHEGAKAGAIHHELWTDMRYLGQSYELQIALTPGFIAGFHEAHRRSFGHSTPGAAVEVVNLRLRSSTADQPFAPTRIKKSGRPAPVNKIDTLVGARLRSVPVYAREALGRDTRIAGPLVIVELSTTAYVSPEFTLRVDDFGNLHLEAA
ncbi:MAG: hydantoinase/oxoprolinase family protein [Candidatus Binataceae bacterium]|nr:hydantoinase/oxoprolinase family protein [Candidatus Binataceae bacterium]